jgi:hypothetical protein
LPHVSADYVNQAIQNQVRCMNNKVIWNCLSLKKVDSKEKEYIRYYEIAQEAERHKISAPRSPDIQRNI